jgi:hypothetical protein
VYDSFQKLFKTLSNPEKVEQEWNKGELEEEILEVLDSSLQDLEKLYQLCQAYQLIKDSMNPYSGVWTFLL